MQMIKRFEGILPDFNVATTQKREYSFSYGSSEKITTYVLFNTTAMRLLAEAVYGFLHDDAGVEDCFIEDKTVRGGHIIPYVWVFGIPVCFYPDGSATSGTTTSIVLGTVFPKASAYRMANAKITSPFLLSSTSGTIISNMAYSFELVFTGNPKSAFCLRLRAYNTSDVSSWHLLFMRGRNLLSGREATIFSYGNYTNDAITSADYTDLGEDGRLLIDLYGGKSNTDINTLLRTTSDDVALSDGKVPLVRLRFKFVEADGVYATPLEYGIAPGVVYTVVTQTESLVGNRRFIVTNNTSTSNNISEVMGMGLIEVEND